MAISGIRTGETGISLALDNNYMEPIATTLVGSGGVNTVIFNDIPQTYKHLQIRAIMRTGGAYSLTYPGLRFNSDNGNNYCWHDINGTGASAGVVAVTSNSQIGLGVVIGGNGTSNTFGGFIVDILDYSNTQKNTTIRSLCGAEQNTNDANGQIRFCSGAWLNTDAVTSITLFERLYSTTIQQYSRFSLYGVKG